MFGSFEITSIRLYTPLLNPLRGLHGEYNLIEVIFSWTEQKLRSILKYFYFGSKFVVFISTQLSKQGFIYISLVKVKSWKIKDHFLSFLLLKMSYLFRQLFWNLQKRCQVRTHRSNCCFLRLHGLSHFASSTESRCWFRKW